MKNKGFGEFLSKVVAGAYDESPKEFELGDEDFAKAAERYFLKKRLERLPAEVDQLKKKVRGRASGKKREAPLKSFIQKAITETPNGGHEEIARHVDRRLGIAKTNLKAVCPPKWHKYNLPTRLADVFSRPSKDPLLQRVKSYISKA